MIKSEDSFHYQLIRWRQGSDSPNVDIVMSVPLKENQTNRKFKVKTVGEKLQLFLNESKVLDWILFDAVEKDLDWETHETELHISLTKTSNEPWKSAIRNPVIQSDTEGSDSALLSESVVSTLLQTETTSFRKLRSKEQESFSDVDSILESALSEKRHSPTAWEERRLKTLTQEIETLRKELLEGKSTNKSLSEQIISCDERIIQTLSLEPSLNSILDATALELMRLKLLSGDAVEEEIEEFLSTSEEALVQDELFARGIISLERQDMAEGIHFLRLAALKYHHPQSILHLVRIYMESDMEAKALHILLNGARQSTDPLLNFTMAQMIDNGVNGLRPLFSLALYFYQRSASQGETTAMCFLSALHNHGSCAAGDGVHRIAGPQRAAQWMAHALERGSVFAYKLQLELSLGPTEDTILSPLTQMFFHGQVTEPNYEEARKYYNLLSDTSKETLKQIPHIEKRLADLSAKSSTPIHNQSHCERVPVDAITSNENTEAAIEASDAQQSKLRRISRAARAGMKLPRKRDGNSDVMGRESCEKWALFTGFAGAIYVLAFPVRVAILPSVLRTFEAIFRVFN